VFLEGNPALAPEKADTTTLGLVWTPDSRLSLTLDWWNIEINDAISTPLIQDVINGCYGRELNPGLTFNTTCALIGRNTLNGNFTGVEARGLGLPLSNSGFVHKTGIDLGARFGHGLPRTWGQMRHALDISRVNRNDFRATPNSILRDCLGYYSTSCTPSHDLRANWRSTWTLQDIAITAAWRYFGAIEIEPLAETGGAFFADYRKIPAYSYFDLGIRYSAPWDATLMLTVNNLFDKTPPLVGTTIGVTSQNSGNTFPQWYDALGRYMSFSVSFAF